MRSGNPWSIASVLIALVVTEPVSAQPTIGLDVETLSKYVWRGVSLTNRPVIQPALSLTFGLGSASLSLGGWANIEPLRYDGENDISEGGGAAALDVTEVDWWADISRSFGSATLTAGATAYRYPNDAGLMSSSSTVELYGILELEAPAFVTTLSVYNDVDKVRGLYLEGGVSRSVSVTSSFEMTLAAIAGWSAGQAVDSDETANFETNGLSHVEFSASTVLEYGQLSLEPQLHFALNYDAATRYVSPREPDRGHHLWFGVSIGWSKELSGAR